jgi:hypothetical protein
VGARFGSFNKMEMSFRADGGMNTGTDGYTQESVWGDDGLSPSLLQSVGSSRGGMSNIGINAIAGVSAAQQLWGGGPSSRSSSTFTVSGRGIGGSKSGGDRFSWDNPFYPSVDPDPAAGVVDDEGAALLRFLEGSYSPSWEPDRKSRGPRSFGYRDSSAPGSSRGSVKKSDATGAVYIFRSEPEKRGGGVGVSLLAKARVWKPTEHSILDFPSLNTYLGRGGRARGALLGAAVAIDRFTGVFGVPFDRTVSRHSGSVIMTDLAYTYLSVHPDDFTRAAIQTDLGAFTYADSTFDAGASGVSSTGFRFIEGLAGRMAIVPVYRHGVFTMYPGTPQHQLRDETLRINFATRDLTAIGVSRRHAGYCRILEKENRAREFCGDYEQVVGELVFPPGVNRRDIAIPLIDDACYEPDAEMFVVQLYLPGGAAIRGEGYSITVIIDDDDIQYNKREYC